MLRVGLTGGLGSGKSTVAGIFETLGIPVYYADNAAKILMQENGEVKNSIITNFGDDCYDNGKLNRPYLAKTVFGDPEKLAILNSIVHPATIADAEAWMEKQQSPYAIKEAALIFESGANHRLDYVIGVKADLELRVQRGMQRDQLPREAVMERMNRQMDEDKKLALCDFIINNNETELLIPQVLKLHETLLLRSTVQ